MEIFNGRWRRLAGDILSRDNQVGIILAGVINVCIVSIFKMATHRRWHRPRINIAYIIRA